MTGATLATWNCDFTATDQVTTANVGHVLERSQAAVLTEARSSSVDDALESRGWKEYRRPDSSDRIVWDPDLWDLRGSRGVVEVHDAGPGPHLPARAITWVTLVHRSTAQSHVLIGSHVTAGYAAPEEQPHQAWREESARAHLLGLVEVTGYLVRHRPDHFTHLLGDLNAKPRHLGQWWYPAKVLDSLYVPDTHAGLDYLLHTRSSVDAGLRVARRWTEPLGSEGFHPAHFKRVTFPRL